MGPEISNMRPAVRLARSESEALPRDRLEPLLGLGRLRQRRRRHLRLRPTEDRVVRQEVGEREERRGDGSPVPSGEAGLAGWDSKRGCRGL